jgi:thioredoxin 1
MIVVIESGEKALKDTISNNRCVVVNFWGKCPACETQNKVISDVNKKYNDKLTFACVNLDKHTGMIEKFKIMSKPTLLVFYRGKQIQLATNNGSTDRIIGQIPRQHLEELVINLLEINR